MLKIIEKLLNFLYTENCYFCHKESDNGIFCSECFNKIQFLPFKIIMNVLNCPVYSCCTYENEIKKLILAIKYHNQKNLAYYQAKIMFNYWQNIKNKYDKYLIIPVPVHKIRQIKRHYNHMDIVGKDFAKLTGYDLCTNFVKRIKNTKPQYNLSIKEREENMNNAFKVINMQTVDKDTQILIIDDIVTTGSTIKELIKELNKNNYKNITVITTSTPVYK